MLIFSVKIVLAIAAALILLFLARKYLKGGAAEQRFVRSLPANMVQEIADRFGEENAVEQYLSDFFHTPYLGSRELVNTKEEFDAQLEILHVPAKEKEDLLRVATAIDENDLLSYALAPEQQGGKPVILAICKACTEEQALELYIYRAQEV